MKKTFPIILFLLGVFLSTTIQAQKINPDNITIARDQYGVPHIFAPTDAEVAYGLAWANAEDGFEQMQDMLLTAKGMMGRKNKDGAAIDYFVHAIDAKNTVEKAYPQLSEAYIRYLDGYCQGVNAFAKAYPKRVHVSQAFPVVPKDIVSAYLVAFSALAGVADAVDRSVSGQFDKKNVPGLGSNAFAFNSNMTKDGNTYLCINPHFMVDGAFTFYEAHLQSEEGLNINGVLFQGGTSIFMGHNESLGWGQTYNHMDLVDIYQLKMHPKERLKYELDGKWYDLEKRKVKLKVKLGPLVLTIPKTTYWSQFGATVKSKDGNYYAIRSFAYERVGAGEQYYKMNKAQDYETFRAALETQKIAMFNLVYADKNSNIYYLTNGFLPKRPMVEGVNWEKVVPGHSSQLRWTEMYSLDSLPHVFNPNCGYVFNTNNSPYNATCAEENFDTHHLASYVDGRPGENNRSERFMELIDNKDYISYEDMKAIKFDSNFPKDSKFLRSISLLKELKAEEYPDIKNTLTSLQEFDGKVTMESEKATLFLLTFNYIFRKKLYDDGAFISGVEIDKPLIVEAVRHAKDHLTKHFGTIKVKLSEIQRFVRQDKDYPVDGYSDVLMANYSIPYKDGKYRIIFGDTYTHFVSFSKDGVEKTENLLPFNTTNTASQYVDQLKLYNKRQTKKVTMDKATILENAVRQYHPK